MSLNGLTIHAETELSGESLSRALQAIIRWTGGDVRSLDIDALLGIPFLIAVPPLEPSPAAWCAYGLDVNLIETASLLGLRLRDLHPPRAAAGLEQAAEFQQHFLDSYRPLIQRALRCGQPILAWCGWPEPANRSWGVLTHETQQGTGLGGRACGHDGPVALRSAALQCYVVEDVQLVVPSPDAALAATLRSAARLAGAADAAAAQAALGATAYDRWRERLDVDRNSPAWPTMLGGAHAALARQIAVRRRCAARFCDGSGCPAAGSSQSSLGHLAEACQAAAQALTEVEQICLAAGSGSALRSAVRAAQEADRRVFAALPMAC